MKIITSFFKPNEGELLFWVDKSFIFCLSPFESMNYYFIGQYNQNDRNSFERCAQFQVHKNI